MLTNSRAEEISVTVLDTRPPPTWLPYYDLLFSLKEKNSISFSFSTYDTEYKNNLTKNLSNDILVSTWFELTSRVCLTKRHLLVKENAVECHLKTCIQSFVTLTEVVSGSQRTVAKKLRPALKIIQFGVHCLGLFF